jgi:hypothetical protein
MTMSKSVTLEPTASEAIELNALMEYFLAEGKRLAEQSQRDQEKIDILKQETRLIASETRAALDDLQEKSDTMKKGVIGNG